MHATDPPTDDDAISTLSDQARRVLARTPPRHWRWLALWWDADADAARVLSRGDLVAWLRANDLGVLARECDSRRVPPGALLAVILGGEVAPRVVVLCNGGARRE